MADDQPEPPAGKLAQAAGQLFPLQVCKSRAGFYLGTYDADGLPFSRESQEILASARCRRAGHQLR